MLGRVPLLGGILVGWLTVLAWAVPPVATQFSLFSGEGSAILIIVFPLWWSGLLTASSIMHVCKLDPSQHQLLGQSLAVISSILINGGAAWALLALISKIARSFKQRKPL